MKRLLALCNVMAISVLTVACNTMVPVVTPAIPCEVSDELLAKECAQPGQLAEGATFMDMVDQMRTDRKALQECKVSQVALRESIKACNKNIAEFNRKIDKLNGKDTP